jgi:response regulator RpfG family c-di-GMP phosphodiesterase
MAPRTKLVCDILVQDGLIKPEQLEAVYTQTQKTVERVEEVLLELGLIGEPELLKSLAARYKAHYISTERLAKAEVGRAVLDMVPQKFAEKVGVCPLMFDGGAHVLTVVTADPDNLEALREVQLASGAREVKPVLARPGAVKALMAKAYSGDIHAFALLDRQAHVQFQAMLNVYERNLVSDDAMHTSVMRDEARSRGRERVLSEKDLAQGGTAARGGGTGVSSASFVELLNVLVSLIENARPDLRGHSAQVARLVRRMAEKMGLEAAGTAALVAAAYVHDLGKMGQYHLTGLNCAEYDGHKIAAQKYYGVPSRLLEPVGLASETLSAIEHMYECYDGTGFPGGLRGKDIPLGARVLAICDTYADLTQNPRNPFRKTLSPQEASSALTQHKGSVFDPNLVDLFHHTVAGEDLKARLLADRQQALLVDVDPEETTVLELRMIEQGFVVKTARSIEQALKILEGGEIDLVVGEVDLGSSDGLALLAEARQKPWGKDMPWVIYTIRQERAVAQRAFELGVLDYVNKPANADVLVAKLKALLAQRANNRSSRGVSGSLTEMGLPDMVQVLFHGRKSGNLRIRAREGSGEIHFQDGNVVNALWNEMRGEDAFYAMLKLQQGDFGLDPAFKPTARVINQSAEALLLEGMRRFDEGIGG